MVAMPLFEVVMSSPTPERSRGLACQLVASALLERDQIEKFEESVYTRRPPGKHRNLFKVSIGRGKTSGNDIMIA